MSLFPMLAPPSPSQDTGGLFDNLKTALANPAVKAGLLQAGMSMLNPNPNSSPFSQIFTGAGEGIMAHQRYQDLETQRQIDSQNLANEQARADQEFALKVSLNKARINKMATDAQVAQANAASLAGYRAKKGLGGGRSNTGAADSAWRSFYRKKADPIMGEAPTPENVKKWRQEFDALESQRPGAGAPAASVPTVDVPDADARSIAIQTLVDEDGYTPEEAAALVDSALFE